MPSCTRQYIYGSSLSNAVNNTVPTFLPIRTCARKITPREHRSYLYVVDYENRLPNAYCKVLVFVRDTYLMYDAETSMLHVRFCCCDHFSPLLLLDASCKVRHFYSKIQRYLFNRLRKEHSKMFPWKRQYGTNR